MRSKGARQYVENPFEVNWLPYVTSGYGYRLHPDTGAKDCHKGIDIGMPAGTDIRAGLDGKVTAAGYDSGYGNYVVLEMRTSDGTVIEAKYAHCQALYVSTGQPVAKGDKIATVGNTGSSGELHLHMEVLRNGRSINPMYFVATGDDGSGWILPGQPGGIAFPAYPGEPMDDERFAAMMDEAMKHLGKPYVFGAKGPNAFDCSGFVCWVLRNSGIKNIATDAQGIFNASTPVSPADAKPGDLIFFKGTYSTRNTVTHVGIYIGNDKMIHSGKPCQYASITTPYWTSHFYSFGRVN
jgi:hypothetical protein